MGMSNSTAQTVLMVFRSTCSGRLNDDDFRCVSKKARHWQRGACDRVRSFEAAGLCFAGVACRMQSMIYQRHIPEHELFVAQLEHSCRTVASPL